MPASARAGLGQRDISEVAAWPTRPMLACALESISYSQSGAPECNGKDSCYLGAAPEKHRIVTSNQQIVRHHDSTPELASCI